MKFVQKEVKPVLTAEGAFLAQRKMESDSRRLRKTVADLLVNKAHTATIAKIFDLIVRETTDRVGASDMEKVLPNFSAQTGYGYGYGNSW